MDRLDIQLVPGADEHGGRWVGVHLLVNGEDLKDLVADFEKKGGYDPAGGYDALALDGLEPAIDRLTGKPNGWPRGGQTVLLVCESDREEGCWPIFARISMGDELVEWRDFEQPHRPERDYSELAFTFSRSQYDAELRRALGA